jgi:LPS-assembly protein
VKENRSFCVWVGALLAILSTVGIAAREPATGPPVEFKADTYFRDSKTNSISGKGNAWARKGDKELRADEIHVDFNTNLAIAIGNVQIEDGGLKIWAEQSNFNLSGDDSTFDNATIVTGQVVITGKTIRKISAKVLEVESGTYSNCNVEEWAPDVAAACGMDWRISGSRFRIEVGSYAHLYDVLVQTKSVPVFYTPYLLLPMKSGRQSGVLPLVITSASNLGTGVSIPYFFVLGEWHDLLATFSQFSAAGMHLGLKYRYLYSPVSGGYVNLAFTGQKFGSDDNPNIEPSNPNKAFGLFGEGAINLRNVYTFADGKTQSRQQINLVTHPFYSLNYLGDLPARADLGYLRNQVTLTHLTDKWLTAGQIQYFQPLTVSKDFGVDRGAVIQLPTLTAGKANTHLGQKWLTYEFDAEFTNYHRSESFDNVPENPVDSGLQIDSDPGFDSNDYLRTGRRLRLEPRLVLNTPMPYGFVLQPVLKTGALLYHFSTPQSDAIQKYYVQTEIPFTFQVEKTFSTSHEDFERVQHVFQPRVIFASDLYSNPAIDKPFFRRTSPSLSNPPFDEMDLLPNYQYFRFELINRIRARSHGNWRRFFLLQASQQYNVRTDPNDPRYKNSLGPIEILGSAVIGRVSWQLQMLYPLEITRTLKGQVLDTPAREVVIGTSLDYTDPGSDIIRLNVSFAKGADPSLTNHTLFLHWYKLLPLFFDLEASLEYDLFRGKLRSYGGGFHFRRKPRSCWHLSLNLSRNVFGQTFTQFGFGFDFGSH